MSTPNLAAQVRDSLSLSDAVITQCVNDVLRQMPAHQAEVFRRGLKDSASLGASIRRATVDVGIILSLAKSYESDDVFAQSCGLVHDVDFTAHGKKVGVYAKAMIGLELHQLEQFEAGKLDSDDAELYELMPADTLRRRLKLLSAFVDQATARKA